VVNTINHIITNNKGCKSDYNSHILPNIRYLTRIISYLKDSKEECNISRISKDCGINNRISKKALLWLTNNIILNIIHSKNGNSVYIINSKWKKLKDGK